LTRESYIEEQLTDQLRSWINRAIPLGMSVFLFLSILDHIVTPEHFTLFLKVRIAIAVILAMAWIINNLSNNRVIQYAIVIVIPFICSAAVEVMIFYLGGYSSGYYAGLGLLVIGTLGLLPIEFWVAMVVVVEVFLVYLVPILLTQKIGDLPLFLSNLFFLTSIFIISVAWRYMDQKRIVSELGLKYDLNKEREKLKEYSDKLEKLVEQRTRELDHSERMLRAMFENANEGILIMDKEGRIIDANRQACEIYGFSSKKELTGTSIHLLERGEDGIPWKERIDKLLEGESLLFETTYHSEVRGPVVLEVIANAVRIEDGILIQAFIRDITEKKETQRRLLQSQKMESVLVLAGGLAHDFNNMLAVIIGHTEIALIDNTLNPETRERLQMVERSADSAALLVKKLLRFARREEKQGEFYPFNLNHAVQEALDLVSRNIPPAVKVKAELCPEEAVVKGDPNDIEQVLINLVLNAKDAMPDGGEIVITTETTPPPKEITKLEGPKAGRYIHLTVSDTGTGIPEEIITRIFEPFFTTKEKGTGTGLGLAMVYGIIKEHHGHISAKSQGGKGSVFHVYLPLVEESTS